MAAKDKEQVKEEVQPMDYVKLIREATQAQGLSAFVRVNLEDEVSAEGLKMLNEEYYQQGYEVFSNGKSVLMLKS